MEENKQIYIAIDSDILRSLTSLDLSFKFNPFFDIHSSSDTFIQKHGYYLKTLLNLAKQDKLRLLIVNTVYQESKHSPSLVAFIKEYCYFPNMNLVNHNDKLAKEKELATLYCKPYSRQGVEFPAPMKMVFNAFVQDYTPSNDAFIMAQATIENACVLTGNEKDFIKNVKNQDYNHDRTAGIVTINIKQGYCEKIVGGLTIVPKPFTLKTIGPIITNDFDNFMASTALDSTKIKADRIL